MADQKELDLELVKPSSNGAESGIYNRSQLPDLLKVYYRWLFPYDKYFEWLQYGEQLAVFSYQGVTYILYFSCRSKSKIDQCPFLRAIKG